MKAFILFLFLVIAILVCIFAPANYNYEFIVLCSSLYLISTIIFLFIAKKKNYFDFDTIFIFVYFIATFYYPLFIHNTPLADRYFIFLYYFNEDYMPQAAALSLAGIMSYYVGSLSVNKKLTHSNYNFKVKSTKSLYILALLSFFAYFIFGGYQRMIDLYSGNENLANEVGLASYLFILCPALLFVGIILDFVKIKIYYGFFSLKHFSKFGIFTTFFIIAAMLYTGSRTLPLQLLLLLYGVYSYLFKPTSFSKFLILITSGILIMFGIAFFRGAFIENNVFVFSDILSDIIGVNRTSYTAIEYTNQYGFTYGYSMLSSLLSPIPFAQSFFISFLELDKNQMSSALLYTKYTLDEVNSFGLGTNIIADIFFSFGTVGVFIFMFLLGVFIRRIYIRANNNIYYLTALGVMISYSVYLVRAEYFYFLRFLLWSLLIMYLVLNIKVKSR